MFLCFTLLTSLGCAPHPPRPYTPPPRNSPDSPNTLYNRLGGLNGLTQLVDDLTPRLLADVRLNFTRKNTPHEFSATSDHLAQFKQHFLQYLTGITGGPTHYDGKPLIPTHANMQITSKEFDAFLDDLTQSAQSTGVPASAASDLLQILEQTRDQIVEQK